MVYLCQPAALFFNHYSRYFSKGCGAVDLVASITGVVFIGDGALDIGGQKISQEFGVRERKINAQQKNDGNTP